MLSEAVEPFVGTVLLPRGAEVSWFTRSGAISCPAVFVGLEPLHLSLASLPQRHPTGTSPPGGRWR